MKQQSININLTFDEEAFEYIKNATYSFKAPSIPILPIAGDILVLQGLESLSFVVLERRLKYIDEFSLEVGLLLGFACKKDRPAHLSVVSQDQAPDE